MSRIVRLSVAGSCYRIIPSKYPTIDLFDDIAEDDDFNALHELQELTNPRLLSPVIANNNYISSPFLHLNPEGSRFSNGTFGVFYAGINESVCLSETRYHSTKFMLETNEPAQDIDMRVIITNIDAKLHNLSGKQDQHPAYYHDTNYKASQAYGYELYNQGADGIRYSSVRNENHGHAYAVFNEEVLCNARQSKHLVYCWDGTNISDVYKKTLIDK